MIRGRCDAVIALKIAITRMLKGTTPSISGVSVWGSPTTPLSPASRALESKWRKINEHENAPAESSSGSSSSSSLASLIPADHAEVDKSDEDDFPELFTDSLTCALMRKPVMLPCGKYVDSTTLERYLSSQESFGKAPVDPFTGVKFTELYRPVFDTNLKFQIDRWSMKRKCPELSGGDPGKGGGGATLAKLAKVELNCSTCGTYLNVSDPVPKYLIVVCGHKLCGGCVSGSLAAATSTCKKCACDYTREDVQRSYGLR